MGFFEFSSSWLERERERERVMRLKIPGRCFSLRSLLRDALMLLTGTIMGVLLSRAIFDVRPTARLAITKRLTQAAVQLNPSDTDLRLTTATPTSPNFATTELSTPARSNDPSNDAVTEVVIGSAPANAAGQDTAVVVNSALISRTKQRSGATRSNDAQVVQKKVDAGLMSMQRRPKTLVEELGGNMRKPLFVGVVTSKQLLLTRGRAINGTWGGKLGKNIRFFSSEGTSPHKLPVVSLPGTDDTYPPQKKVYRMLKYMYDHFINEYDWFMRADDDLYVRVGPLVQFLNTLDPSTDLYIGQPGIGKVDDWDRIQLYPNEHYCMGGPGVILSRSLLIKLAPHLDECLSNVVVSWNEDLEVGRCIMRRLGVQCTWNYELKDKFYQDYSIGEIFNSTDIYQNKKLQNILTLHPLKSPGLMLRVHQFFLELALSGAESRAQGLHWDLEQVSSLTGRGHAFS